MKLTKEITNNWVTTKELIEARCVTRAKEKEVIQDRLYVLEFVFREVNWFPNYVSVYFGAGTLPSCIDLSTEEVFFTNEEWENYKVVLKAKWDKITRDRNIEDTFNKTNKFYNLKKELGL